MGYSVCSICGKTKGHRELKTVNQVKREKTYICERCLKGLKELLEEEEEEKEEEVK